MGGLFRVFRPVAFPGEAETGAPGPMTETRSIFALSNRGTQADNDRLREVWRLTGNSSSRAISHAG